MTNNIKNEKATKMEFNKVTSCIITCLVTLTLAFGGACYSTGITKNELTNLKEQQVVLRADFKEELNKVDERKAEKVVVDIILAEIKTQSNDIKYIKNYIMEQSNKD